MRAHPRLLTLALTGLTLVAGTAFGQASPDGQLHYAVRKDAIIYQAADTTQPYVALRLREPVYVLESGPEWARVRSSDGARGVVRAADISNVWIRISKKTQTLYVYRGDVLIQKLPADLGYNFFSDKEKRGSSNDPDHWRTPDGIFHVVSKNPSSQYHKALVLNYPNREDAERGMRDHLISRDQYRAIMRADSLFAMPPMNTDLGGWIEIHGQGTGRRANWTQGCIAIRNESLDRLWDIIHVGTPVLIQP